MRIYLIIAVCAMVFGAYIMGQKISYERCRANVADSAANNISDSINITRIANEKTFNTGVADIRNVLRKKYTIAD